jgi:Na+-transporting methylmalonyl-CoA/oxaloacetate decarboxylase gamma subunit
MLALLFVGIGFVFVVAFLLSILVSPMLAVEEKSVEDAGTKKLGA